MWRAIRAAGALLIFLPPYSPDLNPIEQAFSKLKTLLRKENARTREQIETCIRDLLAKITTKECANYFTYRRILNPKLSCSRIDGRFARKLVIIQPLRGDRNRDFNHAVGVRGHQGTSLSCALVDEHRTETSESSGNSMSARTA